MFKNSETEFLINILEECRSNLKHSQKEFKKNISSKISDEERNKILDKRVDICTDAYHQYMGYLEFVCGVYLSEKYKEDTYFNSCVESDVMTSKLNCTIKEKYPNVWKVKCELLGELEIDDVSVEDTPKLIKDIFNNPISIPSNKVLNTGMTSNQFYAEFGTNMLYVLGVELEKFYKHTVHVLKAGKGWDAKDKREIRYMIEVFKSCNPDRGYQDDAEHKRWRKKVNRAIGLYQKHWYGLWN